MGKKLTITKDGDCYCITGDNFTNLQESRSIWISEDNDIGKLFKKLMDGFNDL